MNELLSNALRKCTPAQARVVWEALNQFADNTRDSIEYSGSENESEIESLAVAVGLIDIMDAAVASLADVLEVA